MCDQDHYEDDLKEYTARGAVSRRQFGALSILLVLFGKALA